MNHMPCPILSRFTSIGHWNPMLSMWSLNTGGAVLACSGGWTDGGLCWVVEHSSCWRLSLLMYPSQSWPGPVAPNVFQSQFSQIQWERWMSLNQISVIFFFQRLTSIWLHTVTAVVIIFNTTNIFPLKSNYKGKLSNEICFWFLVEWYLNRKLKLG